MRIRLVLLCCLISGLAACGGGSSGGPAATYGIGGKVTGLNGTVVLQDNATDSLTVSLNGQFTFATAVASGSPFSVTVKTQPTGQTCSVTNGSGTVANAAITTVAVACTTNTFTIGGTITGLTEGGLTLANGQDQINIASGATTFTLDQSVAYASAYDVKILAQPYGQTCSITNASGSNVTANVTAVQVTCAAVALTTVPAPASVPTCTTLCFYVDANVGSDSNNGTTPGTPFQTLAKAASVVSPGATVLINSGTYTSDGTAPVLTVTTSGQSKAWIEFSAAAGQHPVIQLPNGSGANAGIHVIGAAYLIFNGLEIAGQNQSITPTQAAGNDGTQAVLNENCVYIDGVFAGSAAPYPPEPHDIMITNSVIHDCSASGIRVDVADAVTLAYNTIYNNGWYTVDGGGGIDIFHQTAVTNGSNSGKYDYMIVGNVVSNNYNTLGLLGSSPAGIDGGHGIYIDDNRHTLPAIGPYDTQGVAFTGRTYIVNNLVYANGGRGVHASSSARIDIVNNTTYNDLLSSSSYLTCCEIDAVGGQDVNIVNNVAILLAARAIDENDGVLVQFNLWNAGSVPFIGTQDLTSPALLTAPANGNFAPAAGSPALASGTNALAPTLDVYGNVRVLGKIDRGAIQVSQ